MARTLNGNLTGRAARTGNAELDESTIHPEANYWHGGAESAFKKLVEASNFQAAVFACDSFWNADNTWRTICLLTEEQLKKALGEVNNDHPADVAYRIEQEIDEKLDDEIPYGLSFRETGDQL